MLEPHTATFPRGSFSRKSGAAVAFQNLDPSINQHPWFTPHNTHTPSFSLPPPSSRHFHVSLFLPLLTFLLRSVHPSLSVFLFIHPSLAVLSLQPPGHFRQAVCNRFINRLFSVCSKHSVGFRGSVSRRRRSTCT